MKIEPIDPADPAARALIDQLDAYQRLLYPPQSNHLDSIEALRLGNVLFVGAFAGPSLVGCGAVKTLHDDGVYGEIKRVFVREDHRGRGVSKAIMRYLERHLVDHGVRVARLETGIRQPEAIGLYERMGYVRCAPFGQYGADPLSVFMEKRLENMSKALPHADDNSVSVG